MTFAVTPVPSSSAARCRVNWLRPAFAVPYALFSAPGWWSDAAEDTLITRPQPGFDHPGHERAAGEIGADEVDHHRLDPRVRLGVGDQRDRPEHAGGVDEDSRRSELTLDRGTELRDAGRIADVGRVPLGRPTDGGRPCGPRPRAHARSRRPRRGCRP